jgi:hypothetical protein
MPERKGSKRLGPTNEMLVPYKRAKQKEAYGRSMDEDSASYRRAGNNRMADYLEETSKLYYRQAEEANMESKRASGANPRRIKPDIQRYPLTYVSRGASGTRQEYTSSERPYITRAKKGQKPEPKRK